MKKELFDEIYVGEKENSLKITYYMLTDNVSEEYCDLKVYGVEIDKEEVKRGVKLVEKKIVKDLFFEKNEAIEFLQNITGKKIMPMELKCEINEYIGKRIQLYSTEKV